MEKYYDGMKIPETKNTTCEVCFLTENTGTYYSSDLDNNFHKGFTIGSGKQLYWELIWHNSGHVTVYPLSGKSGRYIKGDTVITIHFK
jgi:hypothetical protein